MKHLLMDIYITNLNSCLNYTPMDKKIYSQPVTKVLSLSVLRELCEMDFAFSEQPTVYGPGPDDLLDEDEAESPLF